MPPFLHLQGRTTLCSLTEGHGLYLEQSLVSEVGEHQLCRLPGGWFQRGWEVDGGGGVWICAIRGLEKQRGRQRNRHVTIVGG